MVRLKGDLQKKVSLFSTYFNSAMVRLKVIPLFNPFRTNTNFNSAMVRLKDSQKTLNHEIPIYFNSAMVRLKAQLLERMVTPLRISIPLWFD